MCFTKYYSFVLGGLERRDKEMERRGGKVEDTFQKFYSPHYFLFDY
jgi:hypothetical protein